MQLYVLTTERINLDCWYNNGLCKTFVVFHDYEDLLYFILARKRSRNRKINRKRSLKSQKKVFWVRKSYLQREIHETFHRLFQGLVEDREPFFRYHRISPGRFEHLLSLVSYRIAKKETNFRKRISARETCKGAFCHLRLLAF